MARLERRDVATLVTAAGSGVFALWLMSRGRSVSGAAVGALTIMAAALFPLYVLDMMLNRPRREDPGERPPGGEDRATSVGEPRTGAQWDPERTFQKAEAAVERGDLWRAKEILQGTLASQPYHPALYERYGRVLLAMRDLLNAGKYLFLSGRRDPAYDESIAIFLNRFRDRDAGELVRALPSRARDLSRLPTIVADELQAMGWKPRELRKARVRPSPSARWWWLDQAALTVVVLMFIVILVLGFDAFVDLVGDL